MRPRSGVHLHFGREWAWDSKYILVPIEKARESQASRGGESDIERTRKKELYKMHKEIAKILLKGEMRNLTSREMQPKKG